MTAVGTSGAFTVATGADGAYSLLVQVNASYTVSAAEAGFMAAPQNVTVGTNAVTGINFLMSPFCGLSGDPTVTVTVDPERAADELLERRRMEHEREFRGLDHRADQRRDGGGRMCSPARPAAATRNWR